MESKKGELSQNVLIKDIITDQATKVLEDAAFMLFINYMKMKERPLSKAHHL